MATIGVENKVELVSTNVSDTTPIKYFCGESSDGLYRGDIGDPIKITKSTTTNSSTWYGFHLKIPYSSLGDLNFDLKYNLTIESGQAPNSFKIVKGPTDWNPNNYPININGELLKDGVINPYEIIENSNFRNEYNNLSSLYILVAYYNEDTSLIDSATGVWEFLPFSKKIGRLKINSHPLYTISNGLDSKIEDEGSDVGASNPDYIYYINRTTTEEKNNYTVTAKYFYKLFEGDIIFRGGKWYKVKKNIDLNYGKEQDNGSYNTSIIGTSASNWTDSDGFEWSEDVGQTLLENGVWNTYKIVSNNKSGAWVEYNRTIISTQKVPDEITNTLPKLGDVVISLEPCGTGQLCPAKHVYTSIPSLPAYSDSEYYEELPLTKIENKCEATIRYPIHQLQPFDELNTSIAENKNIMNYKIKSLSKFNSFTLANVTAESLDYTIYDKNNNIVKSDSVDIDCYLDEEHYLGQGDTTLLVQVGELVETGGFVEISLHNSGTVKLGSFFTNISIDEGMTEFKIKPSIRDYNDYTPDAWGQIPQAVKAKTKMCSIDVLVPYNKFDATSSRHKYLQGDFLCLDVTDSSQAKNKYTLSSLVMRGIIISVSPEILIDNNEPAKHYRYTMQFLEVV